jgi:hypothetical protein
MADEVIQGTLQPDQAPVFSRRAEYSGIAFSTLLHIAVGGILSLIVYVSQTLPDDLVTAAAFQELTDADAPVIFDSETDEQNEDVQIQVASVATLTNMFEHPSTADLTPTGFEPSADPPTAQVGEAVGIAAGIRKRVKAAGGATGEVQFSLSWLNRDDLDLHVIAPSGERIFYKHDRSRCRGTLDVDMNAVPESDEPVENTRWPIRTAPEGRYTVLIHFYRQHTNDYTVPFQLLAKLNEHSELIDGIANGFNDIIAHRFIYIPPKIKGTAQRARRTARYRAKQKLEERAATQKLISATRNGINQLQLIRIAEEYPHTEAGLKALRLLTGGSGKRGRR